MDEPEGTGPREQPSRAKTVTVVVVVLVTAATVVLCCAAIGELGALTQLRLPAP